MYVVLDLEEVERSRISFHNSYVSQMIIFFYSYDFVRLDPFSDAVVDMVLNPYK